MPTIAVLHETIRAQLQGEQAAGARYLQLVGAATDLPALRAILAQKRAQVLVLDLAALGDAGDPQQALQALQQLRDDFQPEEVIVVYAYTTRATLKLLEAAEVKLLRAPVSLSLLRSSLMSLIARELFSRDGSASLPGATSSPTASPLSRVVVDDALRSLSKLSQAASQSSHSYANPTLKALSQEADSARANIERTARGLPLANASFEVSAIFKSLS